MVKKVPIQYRVIAERIKQEADRTGEVSLGRARLILRYIFRVPKELASPVFAEMQDYGLIVIRGTKFVKFVDEECGK